MIDRTKPNPECKNCDGIGSHGLWENGPCGVCWSYVYQTNNKSILREDLIEMVVGLQAALAGRNDCPDCGGRGLSYVDVDGEAEAEPCHCHDDAWEILDRYEKQFEMVVDEYLWLNGLDPVQIGKEFETLAYGLLEEIKKKLPVGEQYEF